MDVLARSGPMRCLPSADWSGRRVRRRSLVSICAAAHDVRQLKADVVRAVSGTSRGKRATSAQRQSILHLLEQLETSNKTARPATSPLINGRWALLYQAPLDEARAAKDPSGTTEGPFLAALQPANPGLVRTKANLQVIDVPGGKVQNLAEFKIAGRWEGSLNILGSAVVDSAVSAGDRLNVQFEAFVLSIGQFKWRVPLSWVKPKGWVQTTYLDEDFRIGRGDKGSIFVASKVTVSLRENS